MREPIGGRFSLWPKGRSRKGASTRVSPAVLALLLLFAILAGSKPSEGGGSAVVKRMSLPVSKISGLGEPSALIPSNRAIEAPLNLERARNDPIPGVPIPTGAKSPGRRDLAGIAGLRYEIECSPAQVGAFYLDELGEEWMLIDSDVMTGYAQGWSGTFMSRDFKRNLYIFALPKEISPYGAVSGASKVSLAVVPRAETGADGDDGDLREKD